MSQSNDDSMYSERISAATFADCLANSKKIFELIDAIFPVDSCRHYEVLPLSLEENNLILGMLDANNEESLKFVTSIAKVFKYNLEIKLIEEQTLQIILASYPQNSTRKTEQSRAENSNKTVIEATIIEESFDSNQLSTSNNHSNRKKADSAPTIISQPDENSSLPTETSLNLEGLPADLDFLRDLDLSPEKTSRPAKTENDRTGTLYEIPAEFLQQQSQNNSNLDGKQTVIEDNPAELLAQSNSRSSLEIASEEAQISQLVAEVSHQTVKPQKSEKADDFLVELKSQLSWQKLLEQAFKHESEIINLTLYSDRGKIETQKNELLQSSIDRVPLPIFCSLIDEIKRMAKIPLDLSNHPKKVVLERFYQGERILLRLEFTLKNEKELVIAQIFRGENLLVYEQQQMDKVSEQALHLAKQLEKTLRRIQVCFDSAEFTNLRELQTVQSRINHQLRLLDK